MKDHHRKVVQRIREEFEEIPGLRLTAHEASRFWAMDEATCELVLAELALQGFLAQGGDYRFQMYAEA
jgi:Fic family protein